MRAPTTLKIKFKSVSIEDFIERYSVDVSRSGIFIRSRAKRELDVGTPLKFEFMLQDGATIMSGDGTVAWIRQEEAARPGATPGIGVSFDRVGNESGRVLDRILQEKQRRGEREDESRYEVGLREGRGGAGSLQPPAGDHGAVEERDVRTPLPSPIPGLASPTLASHATD